MPGLERPFQTDPPGIGPEGAAMPDMGQQRIQRLSVFGPAAHVKVVLRGHGISIKLLPHGDTGRNDDDEHPQRDPEQCFFRHSAIFFAKI